MTDHARAELRYRLDPTKKIGNQSEPAQTICEVHRRLWRLADRVDDKEISAELKALIEIGYDMAKRMDERLRKYRKEQPQLAQEDQKPLEVHD